MAGRFDRSQALFAEARVLIPGGVTSARHPGKFVPGAYPIFMDRGKGCRVWDVDRTLEVARDSLRAARDAVK
jgi:glutamate-1-semialdehyde aminotransferase